MKKIRLLVLLFVFVLLLPLNADAKVLSKYDSFDDTHMLYSLNYDVGGVDKLLLTKFYPKNASETPTFLLSITKISFKEWYFFSPKGSAVKIDGEIHELSTLDTSHDYKSTRYKPELITSVMFNLTPLAEKIKSSQAVTFRIYFENQPSVDLEIPPDVLAEWKEVIATEK